MKSFEFGQATEEERKWIPEFRSRTFPVGNNCQVEAAFTTAVHLKVKLLVYFIRKGAEVLVQNVAYYFS